MSISGGCRQHRAECDRFFPTRWGRPVRRTPPLTHSGAHSFTWSACHVFICVTDVSRPQAPDAVMRKMRKPALWFLSRAAPGSCPRDLLPSQGVKDAQGRMEWWPGEVVWPWSRDHTTCSQPVCSAMVWASYLRSMFQFTHL